ncbi:hypothetical protein MMC26_007829 [Xylographa opegraphella]|nr:hypothetical protein [Xylographa opegraphella]
MSCYSARKAPNVSQYIANLNTIPSAHDTATGQDGFPLDDDLAIFTNAEFFDFDLGENYDPSLEEPAKQGTAPKNNDTKAVDYGNDGYQFPDLPFVATDPTTVLPEPLDTNYVAPSPFDVTAFGNPTSPYGISQPPHTGDKRPFSATSMTPTSPSLEASSRAAAEEDKRRRNTAASARFRVKKKQREQALEKTAKEMTDRADALEARITQLEMENKWLRNLVVEKSAKRKEDVAELWKRFTADLESRSSEGKKKGVGTSVKDKGEKVAESTQTV